MLFVSIDYDDTYTTCPETWDKIIKSLKDGGFSVFCVTARGVNEPIEHDLGVEVIYCNGNPKAKFCQDNGVGIDIWIDDMPWLIGREFDFFGRILNN